MKGPDIFLERSKRSCLLPKHFKTVNQLLAALHRFKQQFNEHWIMQRHNYRTAKQAHDEWNIAMMETA